LYHVIRLLGLKGLQNPVC